MQCSIKQDKTQGQSHITVKQFDSILSELIHFCTFYMGGLYNVFGVVAMRFNIYK